MHRAMRIYLRSCKIAALSFIFLCHAVRVDEVEQGGGGDARGQDRLLNEETVSAQGLGHSDAVAWRTLRESQLDDRAEAFAGDEGGAADPLESHAAGYLRMLKYF